MAPDVNFEPGSTNMRTQAGEKLGALGPHWDWLTPLPHPVMKFKRPGIVI